MPKALNIAGRKFGRLTVVKEIEVVGARNVMWLCKCSCGNDSIVAAANIGRTTFSCGCLAKETARDLLKGNAYTATHRLSKSPEWGVWSRMKQRCINPKDHKYRIYGARGIKVCDAWLNSFEQFYEDMGPRPRKGMSIDRKDTNGNYEKSNCRWATAVEQGRNIRTNNNITIEGQTHCVKEWCEILHFYIGKPYDLCKGTGRDKSGPPRFSCVEEAMQYLYYKRFPKQP